MKDLKRRKVCVVGLGYVGLPAAAVLASRGYSVHGVDVDPHAVETVNAGRAHIVEPDLDMLVRAATQTGALRAHLTPTEADVFLLCVPTPMTHDHRPDLSHVESATRSIIPHLRPGNLIVLESTSPPGTTERLAEIVRQAANLEEGRVYIAHAPERVLPGKVLREVVENDRVVGGVDEGSTQQAVEFYETFVTGQVHPTSARMAETVKLVENSFRDVNIAFANELSLICDELKLDTWELIDLANKHPRVSILSPGAGVGGHCIAVDPWFIVDRAPEQARLIRIAREVNDSKPDWLVTRIKRRAERFRKPQVALLGLAYKPDIDDLRESPAAHIARRLVHELDADVRIVEPHLASHPEFTLWSAVEAIEGADIVAVLVGHRAFRQLSPTLFAEKVVFDPCGILRKVR